MDEELSKLLTMIGGDIMMEDAFWEEARRVRATAGLNGEDNREVLLNLVDSFKAKGDPTTALAIWIHLSTLFTRQGLSVIVSSDSKMQIVGEERL